MSIIFKKTSLKNNYILSIEGKVDFQSFFKSETLMLIVFSSQNLSTFFYIACRNCYISFKFCCKKRNPEESNNKEK